MVVFDGSGSMAEMGHNLFNEPRIFDARRAVRRVMPQIETLRRIGLITYGAGGGEGSCESIETRFTPIPSAAARMISEIDQMQPEGQTPLTVAVAQAAAVLDYKRSPGVIVLVTDGKETCGGAPCALAAELASGADLTVHVIGFRVRGRHFAWQEGDAPQEGEYGNETPVARCLADQTGGTYTRAESLDELIGALKRTLGCPIFSALSPADGLAAMRADR